MRKIVVLFLLVPFLYGFSPGCGGSSKHGETIHQIAYRVVSPDDSIVSVNITYQLPEGKKYKDSVKLPWTYSLEAKKGDYLLVSAEVVSYDPQRNSDYLYVILLFCITDHEVTIATKEIKIYPDSEDRQWGFAHAVL